MRHIVFEDADNHPITLLIKESAFNKQEITTNYLYPLLKGGVTRDQVMAMSLAYNASGKAPVSLIKEYLGEILPAISSVGTQYIYCADAAYFKALTKVQKAEPNLGYVLPCKIEGYEHIQVVLGVNHKSLIYSPANEPKLAMSLNTLIDEFAGNYRPPGQDIIHRAVYPDTAKEIESLLNQLKVCDSLACDVETGSLEFDKAGIATITFCWNEHEGIAFAVDYVPFPDGPNEAGEYGELVHNPEVKRLLRRFFESYKGTVKWHNSPYDTKVLIYELWMDNLLDTKGLLTGLHTLHKQIHDTKVITYLATNTTAGNSLSLKDVAHEFAGNYGMGDDIKDVRRIPLPDLLEYNLKDGLCTNWVFNKYYPVMVQDNQEALYYELMMPSQKVITQMELTGMPLNPETVQKARKKLEKIIGEHEKLFQSLSIINTLEDRLTYQAWEKDFEGRKAKAKNPDKILPKDFQKFPRSEFNPNSGPQLQQLLYEVIGLPVIDRTKKKQPATGGDTLEKLANHTSNPDYLALLEGLIGHAQAAKILSSFIPAFEKAISKGDGVVYLHGSFNLGGTKSGRLSSSDPNLQNIPAGSTYGKLIKECFEAPPGLLFTGADFNSLEDYVSALTTKDPNKLKVYTDGYDGHCLRAFSYFPERLPGIVNTVESINSIKKKFPEIRQLSKTPTFALTYQGTYITLMKNLGFDEATAKQIEASYHELYKVSDEWVQAKLDEASRTGYVEIAFGLRLRTPLLAQTLRGKRSTPYQAEAEGRTAGNALGQSYGLLTNRAMNAFMERVWNSRFRYAIRPIAMIHDAIYLLIKDDVEVVEWVNKELIEAMRWQELPELKHDEVKLGAELDIFWPTWASDITIPNHATQKEIRALCADFRSELADSKKEAA